MFLIEIGLFLSGLVLGGLISWLIAHKYYEKSSNEQKALIEQLSQELRETHSLKYFELLLERSRWQKEFIGNDAIWVAEENNTFQIQCGESIGEFRESWTEMYSDQSTTKYPVYLNQ